MSQLKIQAFLVLLAFRASMAGYLFFLELPENFTFTSDDFPDIVTFAVPPFGEMPDFFKMPGVYENKMPVWEEAFTGTFIFYQNKHWFMGPDYHKNHGFAVSKESGLTQLPLNGWQTTTAEGKWKDAPDFRIITRDQAQGYPVQDIETRKQDQGNKTTISCGGKEVSSCLDCSTCDTDCFTWPQKWSLQKPCVPKRCKHHPPAS